MAGLILSHRHDIGPYHEDVCRLENGIGQEAERSRLQFEVTHHFLKSGHSLQPRHCGQHREDQVQNRDLRHQRLEVDRASLGVDPYAEVVEKELANVFAYFMRAVSRCCEDMEVRNQEEALVLFLQLQAILQRSNVVA